MNESNNGHDAELRGWIRTWVEQNIGLDGREIALDASFVSLGLDSVHAMMLVGDLEEHLARRLPPTLAWDYSTIATMAAHLASDGAKTPVPASDADTLARLEDLSEEELDRLLRERLDPNDSK